MRIPRPNEQRVRRNGLILAVAVGFMVLSVLPIAAQEATDTEITSAVNTEMRIDNAVSANNIDVSTTDGVVTLSGTVNSILAKERAQALAEATAGVRAIVNRVEVEPTTPRSDAELKQAVSNAWLFDPATSDYQLEAEVDDGVVTITGTVTSYAEKDLAATVAKGVRGVTDVINEVDVAYKETRDDMTIRQEVVARLENDVRVDDALVAVSVDDGEVTLRGTVGSLQEKTQAQADAWVAGVSEVNADDLVVDAWARDPMRRTSTYVSRTTEEIREAVLDALAYDPRVAPFGIEVDVLGSTVTLSGRVNNLAAKRAAEQDARNTLGVWRVTNNIKVRPDIPADDVLGKRIANALSESARVIRSHIDIEAENGWVYLNGLVSTASEKNAAERIAERVQGVIGIVNNIDLVYSWQWVPDAEIRANVQDQLRWSPFVDEDDITVSVDDGVVTLSGTVNSWSERQDAEKNAFQGGARDVINNLGVDYQYYGPYGPGYYGSPTYRGPDYYGPYYEPYQ